MSTEVAKLRYEVLPAVSETVAAYLSSHARPLGRAPRPPRGIPPPPPASEGGSSPDRRPRGRATPRASAREGRSGMLDSPQMEFTDFAGGGCVRSGFHRGAADDAGVDVGDPLDDGDGYEGGTDSPDVLGGLHGKRSARREGISTKSDWRAVSQVSGIYPGGERMSGAAAVTTTEARATPAAVHLATSRACVGLAGLYRRGLPRARRGSRPGTLTPTAWPSPGTAVLELADLDPDAGTLRVRGKGRRERLAHLGTDGAAAAVSGWLAVRGNEPGPFLRAVNNWERRQRTGPPPCLHHCGGRRFRVCGLRHLPQAGPRSQT